jgi:outer membrane protein OmpA-like peptidoglycan-associated protein
MPQMARMGQRRYRQGVVLGLTVAEVMILVCFVLLLLATFAFHRSETEARRYSALEAAQRADPLSSLSPAERAAVAAATTDGRLGPAIALRLDTEQLERLGRIVEASEFERMMGVAARLRGGARLVADAELLAMTERLRRAGLDLAGLDGLLNSVNRHGVSRLDEAASVAVALRGGATLLRDPAIAEALARYPMASEELRHALALIATHGLPTVEASLAASGGLRDRVRDALDRAGRELAASVTGAIAPVVARAAGTIDPRSGAVTFPEAGLFDVGDAAIRPALGQLLAQVCQPWLEALCRVGGNVGEIRIEGHASSEWSGETDPRRAFLNNMDLSQRRASAVLERCLALVGDTPAGVWARRRLVAVGHSSARPILVEPAGTEDPRRSRRVVFRAEIDSDSVLRRLESGQAPGSEAPPCR